MLPFFVPCEPFSAPISPSLAHLPPISTIVLFMGPSVIHGSQRCLKLKTRRTMTISRCHRLILLFKRAPILIVDEVEIQVSYVKAFQ